MHKITSVIAKTCEKYTQADKINIEKIVADVGIDSFIEGFGTCRDLIVEVLLKFGASTAVLNEINQLSAMENI